MIDPTEVKTVILLMFENRSFDHMLGHLSYENICPAVNGLTAPLERDTYMNIYNGAPCYPFQMKADRQLDCDLPHEYNYVATQLALSANHKFAMSGFVEAYINASGAAPNDESTPMEFFHSQQVPITSFLAQNYCICENWFCPIPTSTQPNRTMAFCGDTPIYDTKLQIINTPTSIFKWMDEMDIRWRVYHDGLSFFILYKHLWNYVFGPKFTDYENLFKDLQKDPAEGDPQVIIVEPTYQDAPHIGSDHPNDNHAPLAIGWGEEFLRRTYEAAIANPKRWAQTVMIVYYDEHGGFYDHVPPPFIPYSTLGGFQFASMGPRIPAMIVSPFVQKGSLHTELMDHSSVLQFLSEVFKKPYMTDTIKKRKNLGVKSISATLTGPFNPFAPSPPSVIIEVKTALGDSIATAPQSSMGQAFEGAAEQAIAERRLEVENKYPELLHWQQAKNMARLQNT